MCQKNCGPDMMLRKDAKKKERNPTPVVKRREDPQWMTDETPKVVNNQ